MCALDFDGSPEFWSQSHPVARTQHRCVVCGRDIVPGARYLRESGKWEGELFSDACCLDCETDRDAFSEAHDGTPFVGNFLMFLDGCISDGDAESDATWRPMFERIKARAAVPA